ncbi:hypothetical protein OROHE_017974 [Orobanche hederae]
MAVMKGKKPHVLAVPFPAQGHVKPLMKLSRQIAKHGNKVTFVNTECVRHQIVSSAKISKDEDEDEGNVVLTSVGDGRSPNDNPNDVFKLFETLRSSMPLSLTNLIETINSSTPDDRISCVIVDITLDCVRETAEEMGAKFIVFSPPSATAIAIINQVPKLLQEVLDQNGSLTNEEVISLSDDATRKCNK